MTHTEKPPALQRTLSVALAVGVISTVISRLAPPAYAAELVAVCFGGATYMTVLRRDTDVVRAYGLGLGGLLELEPLNYRRLARDFALALAWATGLSIAIFPLYWWAFAFWFEPSRPFHLPVAGLGVNWVLGEIFVIAIPEEMFFRGYLQTELERSWPPRLRWAGAAVGVGLVLASAIFAVGHLITDFRAERLAVFFPALLFGWLRSRTGGIGAGVLFHASCNLFASFLGRGYGLFSQ